MSLRSSLCADASAQQRLKLTVHCPCFSCKERVEYAKKRPVGTLTGETPNWTIDSFSPPSVKPAGTYSTWDSFVKHYRQTVVDDKSEESSRSAVCPFARCELVFDLQANEKSGKMVVGADFFAHLKKMHFDEFCCVSGCV